jgi:hypothetical protein
MDKKNVVPPTNIVDPANKPYQLSYAFKQQLMQAWRPKPTMKCAISVYAIIGLVFFALGISILVFNDRIFENFHRYDDKCSTIGQTCEFLFHIDQDIVAKPVYFYYQVRGFYQNHRRYIQSISYAQLREGVIKNATELDICAPIIRNKDNYFNSSVTGKTLDPEKAAHPCGLIARTFFNDTFQIFNLATNREINISESGIAWPDDKNFKFKNANLDMQWIDIESERFIAWVKISPFTDFRKSWGIINEDLPKGTYKVVIKNNWNSKAFNGEKWIILSQANVFGGKNEFLAYCYLAVGALSIIMAIIFIFRKVRRPKGMLDERIKQLA